MFGFLKKKATVDDLLAPTSVPDSGYLLVAYFDPGTLYDETFGYEIPESSGYYGDDYDYDVDLLDVEPAEPTLRVTVTDGPLGMPEVFEYTDLNDLTESMHIAQGFYGQEGPVTLVIESI